MLKKQLTYLSYYGIISKLSTRTGPTEVGQRNIDNCIKQYTSLEYQIQKQIQNK